MSKYKIEITTHPMGQHYLQTLYKRRFLFFLFVVDNNVSTIPFDKVVLGWIKDYGIADKSVHIYFQSN